MTFFTFLNYASRVLVFVFREKKRRIARVIFRSLLLIRTCALPQVVGSRRGQPLVKKNIHHISVDFC